MSPNYVSHTVPHIEPFLQLHALQENYASLCSASALNVYMHSFQSYFISLSVQCPPPPCKFICAVSFIKVHKSMIAIDRIPIFILAYWLFHINVIKYRYTVLGRGTSEISNVDHKFRHFGRGCFKLCDFMWSRVLQGCSLAYLPFEG